MAQTALESLKHLVKAYLASKLVIELLSMPILDAVNVSFVKLEKIIYAVIGIYLVKLSAEHIANIFVYQFTNFINYQMILIFTNQPQRHWYIRQHGIQ